jgi:hypothetical protein
LVAGGYVRLDLTQLPYLQFSVILGYGVHYMYHRREIHCSRSVLIGCPNGSRCGVYQDEQANVWVCTSMNQCFPIGDK